MVDRVCFQVSRTLTVVNGYVIVHDQDEFVGRILAIVGIGELGQCLAFRMHIDTIPFYIHWSLLGIRLGTHIRGVY